MGEAVAVDFGADAGQVVAGEQHFAVARAAAGKPVGGVGRAADGALEVGQVAGHCGAAPAVRYEAGAFNHTGAELDKAAPGRLPGGGVGGYNGAPRDDGGGSAGADGGL